MIGLPNRSGIADVVSAYWQPGRAFAFLVAGTIAIAWALNLLGFDSPLRLGKSSLGTLWQVEATIVGLAIALAIFGYEALARQGAIRPSELLDLHLSRALYLGLILVALTGASYLSTAEDDSKPLERALDFSWLHLFVLGILVVWMYFLLATLTEVRLVADPEFTSKLRRARLQRLAAESVERRLVELASRHVLAERLARRAGMWVPWLSLEGREHPDRIVRSATRGSLLDVDLWSLDTFATRAPGVKVGVHLESPVSIGDAVAVAPTEIARRDMQMLQRALYVGAADETEAVREVVEDLRDSANSVMRSRPRGVRDTLDSYATALESFASTWRRYAGDMQPEHLREFLRPDHTPLGLITDSVVDMMGEAIRLGATDAIDALGYFPSRMARLGLFHGSTAFIGALDQNVAFYWLGARSSNPEGSSRAKGTWIYVAEFAQWVVPSMRRGYGAPTEEATLRAADARARRSLVMVGRAMIMMGELEQFRELAQRIRQLDDV